MSERFTSKRRHKFLLPSMSPRVGMLRLEFDPECNFCYWGCDFATCGFGITVRVAGANFKFKWTWSFLFVATTSPSPCIFYPVYLSKLSVPDALVSTPKNVLQFDPFWRLGYAMRRSTVEEAIRHVAAHGKHSIAFLYLLRGGRITALWILAREGCRGVVLHQKSLLIVYQLRDTLSFAFMLMWIRRMRVPLHRLIDDAALPRINTIDCDGTIYISCVHTPNCFHFTHVAVSFNVQRFNIPS